MRRLSYTLFRIPRRWFWHLLFHLANGPQTHIASIRVDFLSVGADTSWIQEQMQAISEADNLLARPEHVRYQKMVTNAVNRILFINIGDDGYETTNKLLAMKWRHGYSYIYLAARLVELAVMMASASRVDWEQAVHQAEVEKLAFLSSFQEGQQTAELYREHWKVIGFNSRMKKFEGF